MVTPGLILVLGGQLSPTLSALRAGDRAGVDACPFNAFYWDFLHRNRAALQGNPQPVQMYRTWDRMMGSDRTSTLRRAGDVLALLDGGGVL